MTQKQVDLSKLFDNFLLNFSEEISVVLSKHEPRVSLHFKTKEVKLTTIEWNVLSKCIETALNVIP